MKTMNDLYVLGRTEPVVHGYLEHVEMGGMTMEQALIGMIFTLRDQKNEVTKNYIDHLNNCTMPSIHINRRKEEGK